MAPERLAGRGAHGGRQLAQWVRNAGRGLVVRQQHRAVRSFAGQVRGQAVRVGGGAPCEVEAVDRGAEDLGDLRESVAEGSDRDSQHPVAGGEDVDHRGLERAGSRTGEQEHLAIGPDQPSQHGGGLAQELAKLRSAVVDHRLGLGLAHSGGDGRWPRHPEVLIHATHDSHGLDSVHAPAPAVGPCRPPPV